jgi:hypothetical protein
VRNPYLIRFGTLLDVPVGAKSEETHRASQTYDLMQGLGGLIAALIFMAFMIAGLCVFLYFCWRYIKSQLKKTEACWTTAAENLGMPLAESERKDPLIKGQLDGVDVKVQVTLQSKRTYRYDASHIRHQAGTLVEASVGSGTPSRIYWQPSKPVDTPDGFYEWGEGKTDGLQIFLPEGCEDPPSDEGLEALKQAPAGTQVIDGIVCWWRSGIEKDPVKLESVVRDCVAAANALQ